MDQTVVMSEMEWQQLLVVLCNGTGPGISWGMTNPLVMKIGEQLRQQTPQQPVFGQTQRPNGPDVDPPMTEASRRLPRN
jgi:hypothetical protein